MCKIGEGYLVFGFWRVSGICRDAGGQWLTVGSWRLSESRMTRILGMFAGPTVLLGFTRIVSRFVHFSKAFNPNLQETCLLKMLLAFLSSPAFEWMIAWC